MRRWATAFGVATAIHAGAALADRPGAGPVTWGHEERGGSVALAVPFTTPDRNRVEVVVAFRYTDERLSAREAMLRAWRASLPDTVDVLRVPLVGSEATESPALAQHWQRHREGLLVARLLGVEETVHAAFVDALDGAPQRLGTRTRVRRLLAKHGIGEEAYESVRYSPVLRGMWSEGSVLGAGMYRGAGGAQAKAGSFGGMPWLLLVNGKHVTGAARAGSAAAALRTANRLIRQELDAGAPFHRGPTNAAELFAKLEGWPGEILTDAKTGTFRGLYNPWRRELWSLDERGEVEAFAREFAGEERTLKWFAVAGKTLGYGRNWRSGFDYTPRTGRVRHGAFLLMDRLSDGRPVELTFKRRRTGLSFAPGGGVEARSAGGPVQGSWWLEAGALHVSLGEYGIGSWPWREAAGQAGFEAPAGSVTPWNPHLAAEKTTTKTVSRAD